MKNNWRRPVVDAEYVEVEKQEPETAVEVTDAEATTPDSEKEILCGVVLKRCPVISYNKWSNVLVYDRDGELIQTNALQYNGEGYVEVE